MKVDKGKVAGFLAAYSPPLTAAQIDAIAEEIAKISTAEIKVAVKKAKRASPTKKS